MPFKDWAIKKEHPPPPSLWSLEFRSHRRRKTTTRRNKKKKRKLFDSMFLVVDSFFPLEIDCFDIWFKPVASGKSRNFNLAFLTRTKLLDCGFGTRWANPTRFRKKQHSNLPVPSFFFLSIFFFPHFLTACHSLK